MSFERLSAVAAATVMVSAAVLTPATPAVAAPVVHSSLSWEQEPSEEDGEVTRGVLDGAGTRFQSLQDRDITLINVTSPADVWWSISFAPPTGQQLHEGVYRDAERAGFASGRAPGLDVTHGSSGCNQVYGEFAIHQIRFDTSRTVSMLEASLTQRCGPGGPALRVELLYKATKLSYDYQLDDDEPATVPAHTFRGATSTFFAQGIRSNAVRFGASGDRRLGEVEFYPPAGERLRVGTTYTGVQGEENQQPGHAAMTVNLLTCRPMTGTFTITELQYGTDGDPTALAATFTLECPHLPRKLTGNIHFNA